MGEIKVSLMQKEHVAQVFDIFKQSLKVEWSLESLEKELDNKLARYFVATINDTVIGFGGMWVIFDEGHITNVAVHPAQRRLGVGRAIFDSMNEYCIENNICALTLEVRENNFSAQEFYSSLAFTVEGRRPGYYADTKEDAIIMWKRDIC